MPPDVRKAFGLPARLFSLYLGYAQFVGAKPQNSLLIGTEAQSASAHQAAEPLA